jgi:hypothetical protein
LQIFVGNVQAGVTQVVPWTAGTSGFSQGLGVLNAGDTVYVALGPNGNHLYDSANLQFQLDRVPEPQTYALVGAGLLALAFRRRRV